MAELINLIPDTAEKCRSLLVALRDNPKGLTFVAVGRDGRSVELGGDEIREFVRLVEGQIGEKTPKAATNVKKNSKKHNIKK